MQSVIKWVSGVWESVDLEIINISILECGILNSITGSEDDWICWGNPSTNEADDDNNNDNNKDPFEDTDELDCISK